MLKYAEIIKILKANNYNKYVTIEFEGIEDNLIGIQKGYEFLSLCIERN